MKTRWNLVLVGLSVALLGAAGIVWSTRQVAKEDSTLEGISRRPVADGRPLSDSGWKAPALTQPELSIPALKELAVDTSPPQVEPAGEPVQSVISASETTPSDPAQIELETLETVYWDLKDYNAGEWDSAPAGGNTILSGHGIPMSVTEPTQETTTSEPEPQLQFEEGKTVEQNTQTTKDLLKTELDYAMAHPSGKTFVLGFGMVPSVPVEVRALHAWIHGRSDWVPPAVDYPALAASNTAAAAQVLALIAEESSASLYQRCYAVRAMRYMASDYTSAGPVGGRVLKTTQPRTDVKELAQQAFTKLGNQPEGQLPEEVKEAAVREQNLLSTDG